MGMSAEGARDVMAPSAVSFQWQQVALKERRLQVYESGGWMKIMKRGKK